MNHKRSFPSILPFLKIFSYIVNTEQSNGSSNKNWLVTSILASQSVNLFVSLYTSDQAFRQRAWDWFRLDVNSMVNSTSTIGHTSTVPPLINIFFFFIFIYSPCSTRYSVVDSISLFNILLLSWSTFQTLILFCLLYTSRCV